ncbi:hypothetical protein NEMBOFW57_002105 [Staphylotrichum longicolle]|uniref:Dpy-30 domain-containing protein n=1 Tax=Staphylotrichum longicolle TaxID=669026 RepID=A0AAD4F7D9_9PEZI|nr:hypothetical protein NEMBOFW57_002105 [Staphylotrichum longicolle]
MENQNVSPETVNGVSVSDSNDVSMTDAPAQPYINSKITGVLLEGMKIVAREQPKDPLRVLGEFLLQRSRELEGGGKDSTTTAPATTT